MSSPIWKGTREIKESPDSPEWERTSAGRKCTCTFYGPYETILASQPADGQAISGYPTDLKVDRVIVHKRRGGKGEMVIYLSALESGGGGGSPSTEQPVYEVEWVMIEKSLFYHPRYTFGGAKKLDEEDRRLLSEWIASRGTKEALDLTHFNGAPNESHCVDFATKWSRGVESYWHYAPIGRRTSVSRAKPQLGSCGHKENPPGDVAIDGYEYVKTADRALKSGRFGRWERIEEWTGEVDIDEDLYPPNS